MLKAVRCILPVLGLSLLCALPLMAADAEPAPTPTPAAGTGPTTTPGGATAPDATQPHVVTPTSGPGASEAASDAAVATTTGNSVKASDLFGYSFRLRVGASAWLPGTFQSEYISSTADMRNQGVVPDRIDWPSKLDAKLEDITVMPELEFCFGVYQYFRLGWYKFNFKGSSIADRSYNYGDITYPGGTAWKGKGYLEQFDVLYEIALVKNPPQTDRFLRFEWRLGIGVKVVNYKFQIDATGTLTRYNPTLPNDTLGQTADKNAQTLPIPIASSYIEVCGGLVPKKFGGFLDTQWISTPKMVINGDKFLAILADVKVGVFYYPLENLRVQAGFRYWRAHIGFEENGGQGRNVDGFSNIAGVFFGLVLEW